MTSSAAPSSAAPTPCAAALDEFIARTGADELMVTANIFDHAKRKRSFEIVAELHGAMKASRGRRTAEVDQAFDADQLYTRAGVSPISLPALASVLGLDRSRLVETVDRWTVTDPRNGASPFTRKGLSQRDL